tara:strand:- start:859 stop:999 length:141 start_codon:yes stop_codon:yes gene_type:complete
MDEMKIPIKHGILWDNWFKRFRQKTKANGKAYHRAKERKQNKECYE